MRSAPDSTPWGSETQIRSCSGSVVLVDQPAEQVPAANIARPHGHRVPGLGRRGREGEGAMGPAAVAMVGVRGDLIVNRGF